jgi:hypothetical protein
VNKKEIEMYYAAGILDGDGSFSIMKSGSKYYPCIQLSNAYKEMSEWLYERFGGSLRIKKPQQPHHKPLYVWSLRSLSGCLEMCENLTNILTLKDGQALLMQDFCEQRINNPEFSEREGEKYSLDMRKMNRDILLRKDTLEDQTTQDKSFTGFWSYIAGIMDTEGSFSIKKEKPHSGSVSARYNPIIQLTMVPSDVLNLIRRHLTFGTFCIPKAKCTQKGYAYKMIIGSKSDCLEFLYNIKDYLLVKKGQLFTLINFCENFGSVKHCQGGIPQETLEFREEMYQQMRKLNA